MPRHGTYRIFLGHSRNAHRHRVALPDRIRRRDQPNEIDRPDNGNRPVDEHAGGPPADRGPESSAG